MLLMIVLLKFIDSSLYCLYIWSCKNTNRYYRVLLYRGQQIDVTVISKNIFFQ